MAPPPALLASSREGGERAHPVVVLACPEKVEEIMREFQRVRQHNDDEEEPSFQAGAPLEVLWNASSSANSSSVNRTLQQQEQQDHLDCEMSSSLEPSSTEPTRQPQEDKEEQPPPPSSSAVSSSPPAAVVGHSSSSQEPRVEKDNQLEEEEPLDTTASTTSSSSSTCSASKLLLVDTQEATDDLEDMKGGDSADCKDDDGDQAVVAEEHDHTNRNETSTPESQAPTHDLAPSQRQRQRRDCNAACCCCSPEEKLPSFENNKDENNHNNHSGDDCAEAEGGLQSEATTPTQACRIPTPKSAPSAAASSTAVITTIHAPPNNLQLDWSVLRRGHLYDRDPEIQQLRALFLQQFENMDRGKNEHEVNSDPTSIDEQALERPSFVVISGLSGTGKSALAKVALKRLAKERGGFYLTGKFDQLQHMTKPYAPFVNAINDFVYYALQQQEQQLQQEEQQQQQERPSLPFSSTPCLLEALQTEIMNALSPEGCNLLLQMIPSLSHIVHMDLYKHHDRFQDSSEYLDGGDFCGTTSSHHKNNNTQGVWEASQDRVKVIFRRFLRVICKPERPCVMVLDDLQWADASCLDLMESLICDLQLHNHGLLLVGVCRSNEISMDHKLAELLRRLEDEQNAVIHNVVARNLTFQAANQMICDVLNQPWDICVPLTKIFHEQTQGNVFYIMNYIKALYADNVLIPDQEYGTGGWLWDDERWQLLYGVRKKQSQDDDNDNNHQDDTKVLSPMNDLIVRQLRKLPYETQLILRTCACLGAEIDLLLVEKVFVNVNIPMKIQSAVEEDLLIELGRRHDQRPKSSPSIVRSSLIAFRGGGASSSGIEAATTRSRYYKFAHDSIQQAAYSLIPGSHKSATHLAVGRMLFKNMRSMEEFNEHIFVVVNQMNRGMTHIDDQSERDGLAALNLKAGKRAIIASDFHTAVQYFVVGTTLLAQTADYWHRQYDLSLELYNSMAEADYCVADFDMMDVAVLEVLQNASSFRDMVRAYATQVYALGARFMLQEAIDLGLWVLERFGEDFGNHTPKRKSSLRRFSSPMKMKRILGWKSKSQLLYMPNMNDPDKLAAMGILNLLTTYSLIGRPCLFPYISARLVKLSLDHGLCAISAPGFAFYGLWLCSTGDVSKGYRYGTLALDILERYENTIAEWVPRVYSVFYGWIAPWKQPLRSTFAPTLHAHRVGLETGDIEYSSIGSHLYSMNAFVAGAPLQELEIEMSIFVDLMNRHKQGPWAAATSVQLQMIHNLMGKSADPLILRGEIMTDEKVAEIASQQSMESYETYFVQVMVWSLLLAYHFGDLKKALATANDSCQIIKDFGSSFLVSIHYFYHGMASLAAASDPAYEATKKEHLFVASKALKKLKRVANHCPENCQHKVFLMQAEFAAVQGDLEKAVGLYNKSISLANKHGFVQDEALANERAALALWQSTNNATANIHMNQAVELYTAWGAAAKRKQLEDEYFSDNV